MEAHDYFTSRELAPGIFHIADPAMVHCTLVIGRDRALLLDTCYGFGDLKAYVKTLTDLPLLVVNSHGHVDHVGGNHQFSEVYIHADDFDLARRHSAREERLNAFQFVSQPQRGGQPAPLPAHFHLENFLNAGLSWLLPLVPHQVFDLGDRSLKAIPCPGHTRGGVALFDPLTKTVLGGDSFSRHVWIFDDDSTGLDQLIQSVERVLALPFQKLLCSHSDEALSRGFLEDLHHCLSHVSVAGSVPYHAALANQEALMYVEHGPPFQNPRFVSVVYREDKL